MRSINFYGMLSIVLVLLASNLIFGADERAGHATHHAFTENIGGVNQALDSILHYIDLSAVWSDSLTVIVDQDTGALGARKIVIQTAHFMIGLDDIADDTLTAWSTADTMQGQARKVKRVFKGYGTHLALRARTTPNDSAGFGAGAENSLTFGVIGTTGK